MVLFVQIMDISGQKKQGAKVYLWLPALSLRRSTFSLQLC